MSTPNSDVPAPDPRDLLRAHITGLEGKAAGLSTELAEVKAELRQYKTALNALTGKPSDGKKTVTRKVVHDELTPFLSEQPGGSAKRATVDSELRQRLKASGFKLNGIARRIDEVLASDSFAVVDDEVTLAKSGN